MDLEDNINIQPILSNIAYIEECNQSFGEYKENTNDTIEKPLTKDEAGIMQSMHTSNNFESQDQSKTIELKTQDF